MSTYLQPCEIPLVCVCVCIFSKLIFFSMVTGPKLEVQYFFCWSTLYQILKVLLCFWSLVVFFTLNAYILLYFDFILLFLLSSVSLFSNCKCTPTLSSVSLYLEYQLSVSVCSISFQLCLSSLLHSGVADFTLAPPSDKVLMQQLYPCCLFAPYCCLWWPICLRAVAPANTWQYAQCSPLAK